MEPATTAVPLTTIRTSAIVKIPLTGDPSRPSVQFFGDSILAKATGVILGDLGHRYRLAINSIGGAPTGWFTSVVTHASQNPPDAVVFELGTNDAFCFDDRCDGRDGLIPRPNFDAAAVEAQLDAFESAYPVSTCVAFVNVSTHNPGWGPLNAAEIDAHLARYPRVVDWDHAWQSDWFDEPDNPHPNAKGQQALVELIQSQLATCPRLGRTGK
ncbi:MAG: SGNH/GDSL hydrolase family protein [Mycobacteriaceae bacterium]